MRKIAAWAVRIGMDPNDDDSIQLQKSLLVLSAIPFAFAGAIWGLMYIFFGEPLAGMIPFSYGIVSLFSVVHFGLTRRYRFFRFSQLLLMMALGGYINGSAVILWALICR